MKKIKVYVAGKISPESVFRTHDWRDGFCKELSEKTGFEIVNLDPTRSSEGFELDQGNAKLIFGRDSFMIKISDLVIVNLTDDISIGGSQEMLIAKYYKKPLIGLAPKGGKFNKEEKELLGKTYRNWINPFVSVSCDKIVANIDELSALVKGFFSKKSDLIKDISIIDDAVEYYKREHHSKDKALHL